MDLGEGRDEGVGRENMGVETHTYVVSVVVRRLKVNLHMGMRVN